MDLWGNNKEILLPEFSSAVHIFHVDQSTWNRLYHHKNDLNQFRLPAFSAKRGFFLADFCQKLKKPLK